MSIEAPKFYLVVLGGRLRSSNIELHDVRWVIGNCIEDTFPELRSQWFGSSKGLHVDSFVEVKFVDGYKISLIKNMKPENNECINDNNFNHKLWFVNLGGYHPDKLLELHEFGLVVAENSHKAKKIAKRRFLSDVKLQHKDDMHQLNRFELIDNCKSIENLNQWTIKLTPDKLERSQKLKPDWCGYRKIDNMS